MTQELARVTTLVEVEPDVAFSVFTDEIDLWWRRGPRFRLAGSGPGTLRFERDSEGRRLVERYGEDGSELFEVGRVLSWKPGELLRFEWRARSFAPDERTVVEVRFEPAPGGTRVVLEHRGWETIRKGHPARHGLFGPAFSDMIALHWGDLVTGFQRHVSRSWAAGPSPDHS